MVAHQLPKLRVASSSLVARFNTFNKVTAAPVFTCFPSRTFTHKPFSPSWNFNLTCFFLSFPVYLLEEGLELNLV